MVPTWILQYPRLISLCDIIIMISMSLLVMVWRFTLIQYIRFAPFVLSGSVAGGVRYVHYIAQYNNVNRFIEFNLVYNLGRIPARIGTPWGI